MSRDVIFDEMSSWYASSGDALKDDDDHDNYVQRHKALVVQRHHQSLSGPETSSSSGSTASPWSGRLRSSPTSSSASTSVAGKDKGKKKVSDCIDAILDGDSSGLESLDEELGIPSMRTLGV